jgi:hypothetical protein
MRGETDRQAQAHSPHATRVTPIHSQGGLDRQVDRWDLRHYPREHVGYVPTNMV